MTTQAPPKLGSATRVLRATARGGALNLAGAAVAGLSGLIVTWLVAAGLGPHVAGQFFTATTAFLLALAVARLGTPTGLVYWFARLRQENRHGELRPVLTAALIPICALSAAVTVLGLFAADEFAAGNDVVRGLALFLPAAVLMEALLSAGRGFGRMRESVLIDKLGRSGAQLVLLAATVYVWQSGGLAVTLAWAVPYVPAALLAAYVLHTRCPTADPNVSWKTHLKPFWTYTAPRALAGVAHLGLQRVDIMLIAAMLGFAEAAVYTVATRFVTVGQLVAGAIGTAVQPRLAASMSAKDYLTSQTLYRATTSWIVAATWPLYLVVALGAAWYLRVFGSAYATAEAVAVVWVLAGGMLLASACGVVDSVLVMAGRTSWQLYNVGAAFVINIVLDLWLIPQMGILGAAIGWCVALGVNNLLPLFQLAAGYGLHPLGRATRVAMATSAVCFGVIPGLGYLVSDLALVAGIAVGGAIYVSSAWRFRKSLLKAVDA